MLRGQYQWMCTFQICWRLTAKGILNSLWYYILVRIKAPNLAFSWNCKEHDQNSVGRPFLNTKILNNINLRRQSTCRLICCKTRGNSSHVIMEQTLIVSVLTQFAIYPRFIITKEHNKKGKPKIHVSVSQKVQMIAFFFFIFAAINDDYIIKKRIR